MALHWERFVDRMPTREQDGATVVAAYPGGGTFVLHWPTDEQGHTEHPDCIWLVGARIPRVPGPHEIGCCCQRRRAA